MQVVGVGDCRWYCLRSRGRIQLDGQPGPADAGDQVTQVRESGPLRSQGHAFDVVAAHRGPGRQRRQLLHLMGSQRIDEQRGERGEREHHIEIRPAQQPAQRGDYTRAAPGH
jgi:hypothetical protein